MILQTFRWSLAITVVGLLAAFVVGGPAALATVGILAVLEISLSFDNAVVNAKVLERMSAFWQRIFLTVGIAVAVFGMRLLFPLLIVGITAKLNPLQALDLAMNNGPAYAAKLDQAHPMIAAFGGIFLLLLFLDFIFEERAVKWLGWLERPLAKMGRLDQLSVVVASVALAVVGGIFAEDPSPVMIAGVLGIVTYLLVNGLGELFVAQGAEMTASGSSAAEPGDFAERAGEAERPERTGPNKAVLATGKAAFFLFVYLEVLDASFSFDGVIGAFAISSNLFVIAAGLGIGALYIRSLTVYLVKKGTLSEYIYLEHGAHWAIGALAVTMLVGVSREVPEVVSGLTGAILILASVVSSIIRNRRRGLLPGDSPGKRTSNSAALNLINHLEKDGQLSVPPQKGQKVSLAKPGGGTLTRVRMGLGWDAAPKKTLFGGSKAQSIDLDASCLLFDGGGNLADAVWFRQLRSKDGSILHTGDNTTGAGDGDDESIRVDLLGIPPQIGQLIFTVNSFTGQDFSQIQNAFCRLVDESTGQEIARYDLTGGGPHSAQIMAKVSRDGQGWSMTAIGAPATGRTFQHLLPAVAAFL